MYDFIDRPVTCLDHGGRFLIWSMRSWVATMEGQDCPARMIAPAFARWKMIGGLQPFHRVMLVLNRDALETLRFHPLRCGRVSEHEAVLLSLVRAAGERKPHELRTTLELIVQEDCIGDLISSLCELARAMDEAGIRPGRPVSAGRAASQGG